MKTEEIKRLEDMNSEEIKQFIKKDREEKRKQKYTIFLPADYEDDRRIEFTQGEVDDIVDKLEKKPERKFSISVPPEYVEILDDIVKRENKRWSSIGKVTRNGVMHTAIREYIMKRGYIVTQERLNFQELGELIPLMALCKDAKKISDFPPWVRGYWVRMDPSGHGGAEYIGDDSDQEVEKWFAETFAEINEKNKTKKT